MTFRHLAVSILLSLAAAFGLASSANADGVVRVYESPPGCWAVDYYTVGLIGDGAGTIAIDERVGTVAFANLSWTGRNDLTPDNVGAAPTQADETPLADSELVVNGVTVAGRQTPGEAGHAPRSSWDWYSWSVDLGPQGLGLLDESTRTLDISGWDTVDMRENNGALLTVVYDTSPCEEASVVDVYEGLDYFFHGSRAPETGTVFIPVVNTDTPSTLRLPFGLAGLDNRTTSCRGIALWFSAGSGPVPAYDAFNLAEPIRPDGGAAGVNLDGIYGEFDGVEIVNDPFQPPGAECVPVLNPAPEQPYQAGHQYPNGAAEAPYRALGLTLPSGTPADADIALALVDVLIPPNSDWIAFQLESENDQGGESGAWIASESIQKPVPGALGDFVWFDKNTNGIQDPGEPGVAGATVELFINGELDRSVVTGLDDPATIEFDDAGQYLFTGLSPIDTYEVQFTAPAGYELTQPSVQDPSQPGAPAEASDVVDSDAVPVAPDSLTGRTEPISLAPEPGDLQTLSDLTWDAGLVRPADVELAKSVSNASTGPFVDSIQLGVGDTAYYQVVVNARAVEEATGLPFADALDVVVTDALPPGVTLLSASVDVGSYDLASNTWTIGDLLAGSTATAILEVEVSAPGPHRNVAEVTEMSNDDIDSIPNNGEVDPPEDDLDIAIVETVTASIGDYVWVDGNANACQDFGEVGIPGVTVELLLDGVVIETQLTDADGRYLFTDLLPGNYTVRFGSADGFVPTETSSCEGGTNTDMDSDPTEATVSITGQDVILDIDHGFIPLGEIGDRVFFDVDADGCQAFTEDEGPVVGATVILLLDGVEVARTTTDAEGRYLFTGLPPGEYTVVFDEEQLAELGSPADVPDPAVLAPTDADCGGDDLDSDGPIVTISLPPGATNDTVDIGIVPPVPPSPPNPPQPPPIIPVTGTELYAAYLGLALACAGLWLLLLRRAIRID